ncbi:DNA ligase D [Achromobacter marplatensis]|uniref:DNA ligase (ATP) n=1 Tax=Achromobacter marplatensis TaxID=470868 RepID=A0ABX9GLR7_9BURK|nr:DNA ligase D [Achromobacter marplatensis]OWT72467.1 DNA ligase D [Achromobacter marplatensis]RBP24231.1 ATP-dependent DNA ligase LigD phosphoesterase module /ATP-dependent DNA ligase LigD polymerase module [Achromobacter marplatensis]CAB3627622.1 Multifunctional non-homologous end joining protein LigD [Achromobacter marplatensis]
MADSLKTYRKKRDFKVTPEPAEGGEANEAARAFVIQKHWASRLHYDFRLELDGAMKSWAVPKGPSYDPAVKRMAVQVEDHPIAYNQFEGQIPEGQYGAGKVIIWDEGRWMPVGDARKGYRDGHLKFDLQGTKMQGRWALVRMKGKESDKQPAWLLIKDRDDFARREREFSVVDEMPDSVVPLRKKTPAKARPQAEPKEDRAISKGDEAALPGQAADLPASLKPQLATLADGIPPGSDDWLYELKFDGYRLLARLDGDTVTLHTRNGHDWSAKLPHLVDAFGRLPAKCAWVDGEAVVLDKQGVPNFQALQNAFDGEATGGIVFYAFDLPFIGGRDLRQEPLRVRRALLAQLMAASDDDHLRFSEAFDQTPADLVASACKMGLEGIIAKRQSAAYVSRRSDNWLKIKCGRRQEFVIVGYTAPQGAREGLGALLLAVHEDDGALRYVGKVGTGFDRQGLLSLQQKLARIETRDKPVTGGEGRGVQWVKPELIAEVAFGDWTSGGHIRHAVFQGLRTDKSAREITREKAAAVTRAPAAKAQAKPAGKIGKLTHPERVIDPSTGLTKLDLARYYGLVAPLLLEHLKSRPVSFLRAPGGIQGELFFQKHLEAAMPGVKSLPPKLDPGHPPLLEVPTAEAVLSAVQMNVVEFHTWNAVKTAIGKPDRMLFDLDPGEGVGWPAVQQAAQLVRTLLDEIGLTPWLKTSGGKGLHVVVPLRRQYDWDTIKAFSQAIVTHLARTLPKQFVAKSGPKNRVGKIFVDYLRNGFGATTVAAWSARARPGLGVSVPVAWEELAKLSGSAHWTIANIHARLDAGNTPWEGYAPQAVGRAMAAIDFRPGK